MNSQIIKQDVNQYNDTIMYIRVEQTGFKVRFEKLANCFFLTTAKNGEQTFENWRIPMNNPNTHGGITKRGIDWIDFRTKTQLTDEKEIAALNLARTKI